VVAYGDTGFLASLYLPEITSQPARAAIKATPVSLPVTPLVALELRNAFNRSVQRHRITPAQRDALWRDMEADIASGFLVVTPLPFEEIYRMAQLLSDRHTPSFATRSLDLLHVAAALHLEAKVFFSFDDRQRKAAAAEGLIVKP
jgi:predicted nucleic acid-binding protein